MKPGDRFRLNTEGDSRKTNVRTCEQMVAAWAAKRRRRAGEGHTEEITQLMRRQSSSENSATFRREPVRAREANLQVATFMLYLGEWAGNFKLWLA